MWWALALALSGLVSGQAFGQAGTLPDALALEQDGDDEAALTAIDGIVVRAPTWELPRLEAARLRMKLDREWEIAELQLEIALSIAPENPRAHFLAARLYEQQGKVREALRSLEAALALRPGYEDARLRIGALYLQAGDPLRSEFHLRRLTKENPRLTQARVQLAGALEAQHRIADAEEILEALAEDEPNNAWVTRRLAEFYERTGRPDKAQALAAGERPSTRRKLRPLPKSRR